MQLAAVCQRAGVAPAVARRALLAAAPWPAGRWCRRVEVDGEAYAVGQGADPRFYVVFPLPFAGHADEYKVVPPFATAAELEGLL